MASMADGRPVLICLVLLISVVCSPSCALENDETAAVEGDFPRAPELSGSAHSAPLQSGAPDGEDQMVPSDPTETSPESPVVKSGRTTCPRQMTSAARGRLIVVGQHFEEVNAAISADQCVDDSVDRYAALAALVPHSITSQWLAASFSAVARSFPGIAFIAFNVDKFCYYYPDRCRPCVDCDGEAEIMLTLNKVLLLNVSNAKFFAHFGPTFGQQPQDLSDFIAGKTGMKPSPASVNVTGRDFRWLGTVTLRRADPYRVVTIIKYVMSAVTFVVSVTCLILVIANV